MKLSPGADINGFRLVSKIGAGGMGEVWKAEDSRLERAVAIKILPPELAADPELRSRLEREARTAAHLYHPNIATIHSLGDVDGRAYIVMEYVDGEPLSQLMKRGPVSQSEVCRIGKAVADALSEAHRHGIIHRDIKPDNIILSAGRVKVLDFGIAKKMAVSESDKAVTVLTQAGMILGTVQYMSPEQALGGPLDARTDLFSLGVVLYELLTGTLPFTGATVTEILTKIIRDEAADVAKLVPSIDPPLAAIVRRCMARDKAARFPSAEELSRAFDTVVPTVKATAPTVVMSAAATVRETAPAGKSGRKMAYAVAAVVLVALVAIGASLMRRKGSTPAPVSQQAAATLPISNETVVAVQPAPPSTSIAVEAPSSPPKVHTAPAVPAAAKGKPGETKVTPASSDVQPSVPKPLEVARKHHDEGMQLLRANLLRPAVRKFEAALTADQHHAPSRLRIAEVLYAGHRVNDARGQFVRTLADRHRLSEREVQLAEIGAALTANEFDRARSLGAEFEARYPGDRELAMLRAAAEGRGPGALRPPGGRRNPRRRP